MKLLSPFLLLVLLLIAARANALSLYVSPTGNDQNPGTKEKPLGSLAGAQARIRQWRLQHPQPEPVEVNILDGQYFLTEPLIFTAQDGGTAQAPVVYKAGAGAKPIFYGGRRITNFEKVNETLWKAYLPETARYGWTFEQLYVNGQRATRAKFPNQEFFRPRAVTETVIVKGEGAQSDFAAQKISLYPEQAALLANISPEELNRGVITFYHKWDNTRRPILRFSAKDTALYVVGRGMKPWNKLDNKTLFTLENLAAALDAPGEWYLAPEGYLYYRPRPGETIETITCMAPVLDRFLTLTGTPAAPVTHLRFENLAFKVAGYNMPPAGNEPMQAAATIGATITVDYGQNIAFTNCEVAHTGSSGIWFRKACADSKVERNYLHDLGAGAVKIGEIKVTAPEVTRNITLDNTIMRSGGHVFPCAVAVAVFNASDNAVTHNEIADFRYSGISVGWVWGYGASPAKRNKIEYNHIHHLGWGVLSDMGGIYTLGPSEGTTVSHNVIHHVYSDTYGGWGLYTDEGSTGIIIENNLVYACKSSGFHQHYGKDNIIRNNIFANQIKAQLEATRIEPHNGFTFTNNIIYYSQGNLAGIRWDKANFTADHNLYWDTRSKNITVGTQPFKAWRQAGRDQHSVIANPGFRDPKNFDFRLAKKTAASKINFIPFDYSRAGVYGNQTWKNLAIFDKERARKFDEIVTQHEQKNKE